MPVASKIKHVAVVQAETQEWKFRDEGRGTRGKRAMWHAGGPDSYLFMRQNPGTHEN